MCLNIGANKKVFSYKCSESFVSSFLFEIYVGSESILKKTFIVSSNLISLFKLELNDPAQIEY